MGLREKIDDRSARVGVLGLGYVGLPLVVEMASAGFRVLGLDVSEEKVAQINAGHSYIQDVTDAALQEQVGAGRLEASTDFDRIAEMDTVSICVPTPLNKTGDPDMNYVQMAADSISKRLRAGQLVVLESTTYPGTTEEFVLPILEASGLTAGKDFHLAFSPERVDPGNPVFDVHNTPRVVGGTTPACTEIAAALYGSALEHIHTVSSTGAAEMVKILENTFRSINIGLVNEIAIMCEKLGLDVWEVIEAAATKPFGFMPFFPGPGLGGHCIPIDPLYLSWKLRTLNYRARFIELATEINTSMPEYVVQRIASALNDRERSVKGSKVVLLGVAYKRDIDDVRESPALDLIELLKGLGAHVTFHDPFVSELQLGLHGVGETIVNSDLTDELIADADCVVISTAHTGVDYARVAQHARLVLDTRNATKALGPLPNVVKL